MRGQERNRYFGGPRAAKECHLSSKRVSTSQMPSPSLVAQCLLDGEACDLTPQKITGEIVVECSGVVLISQALPIVTIIASEDGSSDYWGISGIGFAPLILSLMAQIESEEQMNRMLLSLPPKVMFAVCFGMRIFPINRPAGLTT